MSMHNDAMFGHYPASPLSPKQPIQRSTSPHSSRRSGNHGRQVSRNAALGKYHPLNYVQADAPLLAAGGPSITLTRAPPAVVLESPRLMKEKQREFLERTRLNQKIAASALSSKPDQPRIDPLGSPKGPVTPLALEEEEDYFLSAASNAVRVSPKNNSGTKSPRSNSVSSDEDTKPSSKARKIDV